MNNKVGLGSIGSKGTNILIIIYLINIPHLSVRYTGKNIIKPTHLCAHSKYDKKKPAR